MTNLIDFIDDDLRLYPISNIAANEWREFAMYTVESRAIPNMIDGMKPVQRFYLYSSLINSKRDFKKVSAISGTVSEYGYNHGENACAGAGQLMAAEWSNNICLVEGRGSFGTRLIQVAAAPRYTYTKLHENFNKYIKDIELSPQHVDPEHAPPSFYIPVIPLVLVNGIKGIATGFATNILPRDPISVIAACKEYLTTGKIKKRLPVKFPHFIGTINLNYEDGKFYCNGVFTRRGKTVINITEVPYGYDREGYITILDKLEEKGDIVGYDDYCDKDGFKFEVKLKQSSSSWDDDKIIKEFKLSKPLTENLTVIDDKGKIREYGDERDLIKDFCDYRKNILQRRIDLKIQQYTEDARWLKVKAQFIENVLDDNIKFKNNKKAEVERLIKQFTEAIDSDIERLLRLNIVSLTSEMVKELHSQIKAANDTIKYWKKTTPDIQFLSDIDDLGK